MITLEFILIEEINDTFEQAEALTRIALDLNAHVNLIPYNPTGIFKPSKKETIKRFKETLSKANVKVTQRYSFGQDIDAACGQLAAKKNLQITISQA